FLAPDLVKAAIECRLPRKASALPACGRVVESAPATLFALAEPPNRHRLGPRTTRGYVVILVSSGEVVAGPAHQPERQKRGEPRGPRMPRISPFLPGIFSGMRGHTARRNSPTSAMQPAGQDPETRPRVRNGHSTALFNEGPSHRDRLQRQYLSRANHRRNAEAGIQRDAADPIAGCPLDLAAEQGMATPVVPNQ